MKQILFLLLLAITNFSFAQTNVRCTNTTAEKIMLGNYNPVDYKAQTQRTHHGSIICDIQKNISTDSLKAYLIKLETFHTRHTYSDTVSKTTGIGAARRWGYDQFALFSQSNNNRLLPAYIEFDYPNGGCGNGFGWKNTIAVLPGIDTSDKSVVIIEAHLDSRCEDACDINCFAAGIEDNGSGVALVLELARVMAAYNFNETIVFMLTIGEEQGLYGAKGMAKYCDDKGIKVKAVLNNDVVGGITCGETSSPPSCEGEGSIDSTQLRIFSNGGLSLAHRGLARSIQMFYNEKLKPIADVPMTVSVMDQEDRTGRGGDHIPFREKGYTSIRFTAANEHGDAHPDEDYADRQHSTRDVLGADTDGDQVLDVFYVDFNYLKRNAVINGMSATLLALGPQTPTFMVHDEPTGLRVEITGNFASSYRIGVRGISSPQGFDALYRTSDKSFLIPNLLASTGYRISVAGINAEGIMSSFSGEILKINDVQTASASKDLLSLTIACDNVSVRDKTLLNKNAFIMSCAPNPNNGNFTIKIETSTQFDSSPAIILVTDITGREVHKIPFQFHSGMVEITFDIELTAGQYVYALFIDNKKMESKKLMVR